MKLVLARTANSEIHVHRAECADLRKWKYSGYGEEPEAGEWPSVQAVCEDWYSDFIGNEAEGNGDLTWQECFESWGIKFFPCIKGLPHETPVAS
jgi:hypothetical protein